MGSPLTLGTPGGPCVHTLFLHLHVCVAPVGTGAGDPARGALVPVVSRLAADCLHSSWGVRGPAPRSAAWDQRLLPTSLGDHRWPVASVSRIYSGSDLPPQRGCTWSNHMMEAPGMPLWCLLGPSRLHLFPQQSLMVRPRGPGSCSR